MIDGEGLPIVNGTTSGLVLLGSIKKQAEQDSRQHSSMASASILPPGFYPLQVPVMVSFSDGIKCESVSQMNPFLST